MSRIIILIAFIFSSINNLIAGTIIVSSASIPSFGNCAIYYASDPQRYTVSGSALSAPITITAPAHFEISLVYNSQFSSSITLNPTSGNVSNTLIFVRFSPHQTGSKSGNIVHSSAGSTTQNKAVSGNALASTAVGTNAATYYNSIGNGSGTTLKTALYNKILGHTVISYGSGSSGLWATYPTTDPFYNGKVWDIYSTRVDANSPFEFTFSSDQCGNYSVEGDCYNREHSFPQSWFSQASPMVSDMFHIYPTDGKVNGIRSNYPFGEVSTATYTSLQGAKLGNNTTPGYTGIVFEPINDYKGDLARSFFYMATRYQNVIANWQNNGNANDVLAGNNTTVYDPWYLELLLKWHNQDPPSAKEINRNNAIFTYQNNRNPFIDSPHYVQRIWGTRLATEPTVAATQFSRLSFGSSSLNISWKSGNGQKRLVLARAGAPVNAVPSDSQTYLANTQFGLGSSIGSGNFVVYNGMGSNIEISGLNPSIAYHFLIVEYNGVGTSSNYLTTNVLNSGAVSLPVNWLMTKAEFVNEQSIYINWQTASEKNNDYFVVERLNEDKEFYQIGSVKGNGNRNSVSNYLFEDNKLIAGINSYTYRIKQVDFDGGTSYSKEFSAKLDQPETNTLQVVNPIENGIQLYYDGEPEEIEIWVNNLKGECVINTKLILTHDTFIPMESTLTSGMYVLRIMQRSGVQSHKIIKP
ncbi:MAG: endonuclease [Bacteroidia bacterium]|nr:endonuclease [Bacteroidia bacterium]